MSLNPLIGEGYEIREDSISFDLPFVKPVLASSADPFEIFARCGPMTYTITINSKDPSVYNSAITLSYSPTTAFESAVV